MWFELSSLALHNLLRVRARLLMTIGGVLIGTTAVVLLIALSLGLQNTAEAGLGSNTALTEIPIFPNTAPDAPPLDWKAVETLTQLAGVDGVVPLLKLKGGELVSGAYASYAPVIGVEPDKLAYLHLTAQQGNLTLAPGSALVGALVGNQFYDPRHKNAQVSIDAYKNPLNVVLYQFSGAQSKSRKAALTVLGELTAGTSYDYQVLMPLSEVQDFNDWLAGSPLAAKDVRFDQLIVRTTQREVTSQVADAIRAQGFVAGGIGDILQQVNSFFFSMRLVLGGVGGVALLVAAFGIANTMTMAILERTKEIGIMKALGARNQDVLIIFLVEAGSVGLIGGTVGVGLSFFLQSIVNSALKNNSTIAPNLALLPIDTSRLGGDLLVIPPELALLAVILAVVVGLVAGFYPAWRAAQLPPMMALKQE